MCRNESFVINHNARRGSLHLFRASTRCRSSEWDGMSCHIDTGNADSLFRPELSARISCEGMNRENVVNLDGFIAILRLWLSLDFWLTCHGNPRNPLKSPHIATLCRALEKARERKFESTRGWVRGAVPWPSTRLASTWSDKQFAFRLTR